jgi:hypothetical protein
MPDRRILFIFIDGIGLGENDPAINPFAVADTPTLFQLANGKRWLKDTGLQISERAAFIPTDAQLGISGRPQSGTSQAAILTGLNVPEIIGRHYGPKPDAQTRAILSQDNFFMRVQQAGMKAALLTAYPPHVLADIARGYALPTSIQYAAIHAGQRLLGKEDVISGHALTAEWTGTPWRDFLKIEDIPLYTPRQAGEIMVRLAQEYAFSFHSHWMTDYVGHRGPFESAVQLLELLDGVLEGVMNHWDDEHGLVILTSDHGNMEHIGDRKHTENKVPTVVVGHGKEHFASSLQSLMDLVPLMQRYLLQPD